MLFAVDIEWALLICHKMAKTLIFEEVNFSIEEELEIILIKGFDVESHIKGYHIYRCTIYNGGHQKYVKFSRFVYNLKILLMDLQWQWEKNFK